MRGTRTQRLTLVACILGSAIVFVDGTVVNVALPAIRESLGASLAGQQWVVAAYLLLLASLILAGGSLGDLYGRRRIFALGVAGFGAASLLCALAPTVEVLIAARALQGAFGALLVPSSLAIIATVLGPEDRAAAIGAWTAGTSAAIAVGPPLGGLLVDTLSWRAIFALNVPFVLICMWLIARVVPECPGSGTRRVDVPGVLLSALGFGAVVYALIRQPALGWSHPEVWVPLVGGVGALAAFFAYERRAPDPMLPLAIFRSRNFAVGNAVTLVVYAGLGAATFFAAIFLQQVAGYSAFEAGLALTPITLALVTLSGRFGALSTRIGPRLVMGAGPLVGGLGLLAFARVDERADYVTQVLPAVVLFGLGLAITVAPLTATVLQAADRRHAGIASGVNNAVARVAALLAIAAIGAVVSAGVRAGIDERLAGDAADASASYLQQARERPPSVPERGAPQAIREQVRAANVEAFHGGMVLAGLLMIAGGIIALVGIENPRRPPDPQVEAQAAAVAA